MSDFLTGVEMNLMQQDFGDMLQAPESCELTINYKLPIAGTAVDPVYGTTSATSWQEKSIPKVRAIQEILGPRSVRVLEWGILEIGDCIFYIQTDVDLTVTNQLENTIITCNNVNWLPVTRKLKAFYNYLIMRFGNGQIGQVIPCKLQQ